MHAQLARMSSPILDALSALDEMIHEAVSRSLESLRKHGSFRGRGANKLVRPYSMWQRINGGVLNDAGLETEPKELDDLMRSYQAAGDKSARDAQVGDIMARLAEIAAMTFQATREARRQGTSRAAALEL